MKTLAAITLASMAIFFSSCGLILSSSEKAFQESLSEVPYDVIIVPGVPFENDNWSSIMKLRVYWSVYLYEQGITKNIMYSGSAVYSPYIESKIMSLYAQQLGVPADRIFTETRAEHSTENLYYSTKLAENLGFEKIALATDPFQSAMLKNFREKRMSHVSSLPVQFDVIKELDMTDPQIDHASLLEDNFVSIKQREGFFKRFRGTMGKNIDYQELKTQK